MPLTLRLHKDADPYGGLPPPHNAHLWQQARVMAEAMHSSPSYSDILRYYEMLCLAPGFQSVSAFGKAQGGEGSRGGKIIGHTRSGKPIYAPGAGGPLAGAAAHVRGLARAPDYSPQDHVDAAEAHAALAQKTIDAPASIASHQGRRAAVARATGHNEASEEHLRAASTLLHTPQDGSGASIAEHIAASRQAAAGGNFPLARAHLEASQAYVAHRRRQAGGAVAAAKSLPAFAKAEGEDSWAPPQGVRDACRRGLDLRKEHGGDGLTSAAVRWAGKLARGEAITPEKARAMHAFHSRHAVDRKLGWGTGKPTPGYVSFLLWGGDGGKTWSGKLRHHLVAKSDRLMASHPTDALSAWLDIDLLALLPPRGDA